MQEFDQRVHGIDLRTARPDAGGINGDVVEIARQGADEIDAHYRDHFRLLLNGHIHVAIDDEIRRVS
jgi:hypothetical protein